MRIGIDLGGTKIEVIALANDGRELFRHRIATPRHDYQQTLEAITGLVKLAEENTGQQGSVGVGIPGTLSPYTGLVKNANSVWLNGQPLDKDLSAMLAREVRIANDANCLAVSEATDGAAAGKQTVFAVIIGTGCGAGVAINGRRIRAVTASLANGGITRCRGWTMTNCVFVQMFPATAANRAVSRPLSPAPALPPIMRA